MDKLLTRQKVDLAAASPPFVLTPDLTQGSAWSMLWETTITRLGKPADMTGAAISAEIVRPDGKTVTLHGSLSGNTACVLFDPACCEIPGKICGTMWAEDEAHARMAIARAWWYVRGSKTDEIIETDDPAETSVLGLAMLGRMILGRG